MENSRVLFTDRGKMAATAAQLKQFQDNGYLIVENFLSDSDVESLKKECYHLVEKMNPEEHHTIFSSEKQTYRNDYFMNSQDKIGYFFEDGALDEEGKLKVEKHRSLNKIGHTLHVDCPSFRRVTFSQKVKDLLASLGVKDGVVSQSMYIFKQPRIGGAVNAHQDMTWLNTDPPRLTALWIALEDATKDNGCLWFIPGSHKNGLHGNYRMIRNPDIKPGSPSCIYVGEKPEYEPSDFVAGPVKKGTLVTFDGFLVHKSAPNTSDKSRHIYTFHVYDAQGETKWNEQNWMQPTERGTFQHLNEVEVE